MSAAPSAFKRFVQVGRVVLVNSGPSAGKIAVIVEIIDHKRAIIEGPTTGVPRQSFTYRHLTLTTLVVPKLPRAAGTTALKAAIEKSGIIAKWEKSAWAQKREAAVKRHALTDFERFTVMLAKKQRRDTTNKSLAKKA